MMNIHIEDSDSDTIGGYIFGLLGRTPIVGDTVDVLWVIHLKSSRCKDIVFHVCV